MKRSWFVIAAAIPLVVVGSIAVWQLSSNEERRAGAIGAGDEPVPLTWRGAWDAEAKYAPGQVVSFNGAAYVAEQESAGSEPQPWCEEDCRWALMSRSGEGPQGPKGDPGPAGPKGDPGAKGDPGPGPGITGRVVVVARGESSQCANPLPGQECHPTGWTTPSVTAECPPGKVVTGGAGDEVGAPNGNGWRAELETGGFGKRATAWAVCVDAAS